MKVEIKDAEITITKNGIMINAAGISFNIVDDHADLHKDIISMTNDEVRKTGKSPLII